MSIIPNRININERWLKVFYHDISTNDFFLNESEALYSTNPIKYSILSTITNKYKIRDKYEFIIYWPLLGRYYRWRQSINPIDEDEQNKNDAEGFHLIYPKNNGGNKFGGLVKTTIKDIEINAFLNGMPGVSSWYYAIGMYNNALQSWKTSGYPTYAGNMETKIVSLYLLISNKAKNYICLFTSKFTCLINIFILNH